MTYTLFYVKDNCPQSLEYGSLEVALDDACYFGFKIGEFTPTRIMDSDNNVVHDYYSLRDYYKKNYASTRV